MKTREKILEKAVEMFNQKGIEYIGMRELAAELGMRIGNITYYFPTKDELVNEISKLFSEENSKILVKNPDMDPGSFLRMMRTAFENQERYRCIPLSLTHLLDRNALVAEWYKTTQTQRNATMKFCVQTMVNNQFLKERDEHETSILVSTLILIARFWISEAKISQKHLGLQTKITWYIEMIARILLEHSTSKGKKAILAYLESGEA